MAHGNQLDDMRIILGDQDGLSMERCFDEIY